MGGDFPKIIRTWHISVTYYLAVLLLLCGIYIDTADTKTRQETVKQD